MPWYCVLLIVILVLVALLFIVFITNGDGKMVEFIYDKLIAYHNNKDTNEKI